MRIRLGHPLLAELQQNLSPFTFPEEDTGKIYFIRSGKAIVSRAMGKDNVQVVMAELAPGDYIGNIPFLDTGLEPNNGNILVSKDITLEAMNPMVFQDEYNRLSATFKNIIKHVSASITVTVQTGENAYNRQ